MLLQPHSEYFHKFFNDLITNSCGFPSGLLASHGMGPVLREFVMTVQRRRLLPAKAQLLSLQHQYCGTLMKMGLQWEKQRSYS